MNQRNDALLPAARLVESVNHIARSTPGRQVATVGRIQAEPGAPNVIPGKVVMSLEIRDLEKSKIDLVFEKVKKSAEKIAADTGTTISFAASAVSTSGKIQNIRSSREVSKIKRMVSCTPLRKNFPPYASTSCLANMSAATPALSM